MNPEDIDWGDIGTSIYSSIHNYPEILTSVLEPSISADGVKTIRVEPDTILELGDKKFKVEDLARLLTLAEKIVKDKYPEEFV